MSHTIIYQGPSYKEEDNRPFKVRVIFHPMVKGFGSPYNDSIYYGYEKAKWHAKEWLKQDIEEVRIYDAKGKEIESLTPIPRNQLCH